MAEEPDSGSKTEDASPRKLEEARRRGDVAKSSDFTQWASLAGAVGVVIMAGGAMSTNLARQLQPFIEHPQTYDLSNGGGALVLKTALYAAAPIILAVMGGAAAAGVFGNLVQTGFLFSPEKLAPDFSRVSPMKGLERLVGIDGLVNFLRSAAKIGLVGALAWMVIRPHTTEFQTLVGADPLLLLPRSADMLRQLFYAILALLGAIAIFDWFWQRQRFMQRMRMSKEELKEDFRQAEGDPHIKAKIKQIRNERSRRRMMQNVPKATVVLMNPTHYAVALRYVAGETPAPLCVAKGMDSLALRIREIAEEHGVPVVEDAPLARALFATVEIDQTIPHEHYNAVAKVIGFVLQTAARRRGRR